MRRRASLASILVLGLALCFALGLDLDAGTGLGVARVEAQPRRGQAAASDRREQIKKRIRAMRAYTLTEALSLDEQTAARLFPMLARYDDETDKLLERRAEIQRRLRRADTLGSSRALDRLIDEALANQRSLWDLEDKKIAELRKVLTPSQTAKLLVVLPAIDRRIQNQLRRAIERHPGPGATGPAEATDDDDALPDELPPPRQRNRREGGLAPRSGSSNAPGNTCDPSAGPCR